MGSVSMQILLKRALLLFGASMVTAMLLDAGLRYVKDDAAKQGASDLPSTANDVKPWNGGKTQPRVNLSGELTQLDDADLYEFAFEVDPQEKCQEVLVRVRGIDGATLAERSGESFSRQALCSEGISGSVRVVIPRASGASIVIDVEMRDANGGRRSLSRVFAPPAARPVISSTSGAVEKASNGPQAAGSPGAAPVEFSGDESVHAVEVK